MQEIIVELPIATAKRLERFGETKVLEFFIKKCLTGYYTPCYYGVVFKKEDDMPNMHKVDTRQVTFRLKIETAVKLQRYAQKHNTTVTNLMKGFIAGIVDSVVLTEQDYIEIAQEVARNVRNRNKM